MAATGVAASALGGAACGHGAPPDLPDRVLRSVLRGGSDVTFFVAADTHFGATGMVERNRDQIVAMKQLPGTYWPARSEGRVAEPRGVIVAGDLTESGAPAEWQQFVDHYGGGGAEGRLGYPVWVGTGNHDRSVLRGHGVLEQVRQRHGALRYGFAWDDVRFLCLDQYPDERGCRWLRRQLTRMERTAPVVLFFHYPLAGMLAGGWRPEEKERFALSIVGANVVGIFHGHYHKSERYRWQRHDVFNPGSPKHQWTSFLAARITDRALLVAEWDWGRATWGWWHREALAPPAGRRG